MEQKQLTPEELKKLQNFIDEYTALSAKYDCDFHARLVINELGIKPQIVIGPKLIKSDK